VARDYVVIVVGSGFGGGIAACRLAEAGLRVCVLERGRRFAPEDFINDPNRAGELIWHERLNPGGLFDVRLMRDVSVITAAGVGGGSLVYANVQLRAPAAAFAADWPAAIDRLSLDPWYDRTEEALEPRETPASPSLPKWRNVEAQFNESGVFDSPFHAARRDLNASQSGIESHTIARVRCAA
jgi:cholesterol oxidase